MAELTFNEARRRHALLMRIEGVCADMEPTWAEWGALGERARLEREALEAARVVLPELQVEGYYVAPDGDDATGDGSLGTPWRTLTFATAQLGPGDILNVREGVYAEAPALNEMTAANGTAERPITVRAHDGEEAVIVPPNGAGWVELLQLQRDHWRFEWLVFDGQGDGRVWRGIELVGANHCTLSSCTVRDINAEAQSIGIYVRSTADLTASGNTIKGCGAHDVGAEGIYIYTNRASELGGRDPLAVDGNQIIGCKAYRCGYDGIQVRGNHPTVKPTDTRVQGCESYANGTASGDIGGMQIHGTGTVVDGCYIHDNLGYYGGIYGGGDNVTIKNCRICNNAGSLAFNVAGITAHRGTNWLICHNTVHDNNQAEVASKGIRLFDTDGCEVLNNIVWGEDSQCSLSGTNTNHTISDNDFWGWADTPGTNRANDDPLLSDEDRMTAESPCRGAGVYLADVQTDIDGHERGDRPDLGCSEYVP